MAGASADAADDVSSEVLLLWTVVFAMADASAILADLVLIIAKGTVEGSKFTELIAFVIILSFRGRSSLLQI